MRGLSFLLALVLLSIVSSSACKRDGDVRDSASYCNDNQDCPDDYVCRAHAGGGKVCVDLTTSADGGAYESDADASDEDAGPDSDVLPDTAPECLDNQDCSTGEICDDGICVIDERCPLATLKAREANSADVVSGVDVEMQTAAIRTVEFDATQSRSAQGEITEYAWTLIAKPRDSTAELITNNNGQGAELFVDAYGDYTVLLSVTDSSGTQSCASASAKIIAAPDDEVAVQLTWSSPLDPDWADGQGANLDLHYVRGSAAWDSFPGDAFVVNDNPDWGAEGDTSDNPKIVEPLLLDGYMPIEQLVHSQLESGLTYRVGVNHMNHGWGGSYATVQVYLGGALAYEKRERFLEEPENSFWYVGDVVAGDLRFTEVDTRHADFP